MAATVLLRHPQISVLDYRCDAAVGDKPYAEFHDAHSIAYVRKGSFAYRSGGRTAELVAGSVLAGHPGDEFVCSHDHVCGDLGAVGELDRLHGPGAVESRDAAEHQPSAVRLVQLSVHPRDLGAKDVLERLGRRGDERHGMAQLAQRCGNLRAQPAAADDHDVLCLGGG